MSALAAGSERSADGAAARDRALLRSVVVRRLLALDEAGRLGRCMSGSPRSQPGVHVRTVWRWLTAAKESGSPEPARRRSAFRLTDALWAWLGELGGNVKALHRWMAEHADEVLPALGRDQLPSPATLHEAVHREQRAGRVLDLARPGYARIDPAAYGPLVLPGRVQAEDVSQ